MYNYREIALATLREHNRAALDRMRREGTLEDFLDELVEQTEGNRDTIAYQLNKKTPLPEDFMDRVRRLNGDAAVAREIAASELVEFLSVPEGSEESTTIAEASSDHPYR